MSNFACVLCLLGLLYFNCARKPTETADEKVHYSSYDDTCDVQYDPNFMLGNNHDTCNGYLDIKYGSVTVCDSRIVCTLVVTNLPDTLLFNNESLEPITTEYWWEFVFRNKIDTTRFIYLATAQYKRNDSPQWYGHIADYTFQRLAIDKLGEGGAIYYNYPVFFTKNGNTLVMTYYDDEFNLGAVEHVLNSSIRVDTRYGVQNSLNIEDSMVIVD